MKTTRLAAVLMILGLAAACARNPRSNPGDAWMPQTPEELRSMVQQRPGVVSTALVTVVLPEQQYVTVSDIQGEPLAKDDVVTIMDAQDVVAVGSVVTVMPDQTAQVSYSRSGPRDPAKGDLLVKIKK